LDSGFTADQVLAEAETAFAQVHRDMLLVSRQLWARYFPTTPLPPDDADGRRETIERAIREVGRDHGQPAELASNAQATVARLKQFIMERNILRLRQQVQREAGSEFNLARFHESVLEQGSVLVKYLRERVQASLQTKKPKP
jgi:hypothetical protein